MSRSADLRLDVDHIGILGPDIESLLIACRNLGFDVHDPAELAGADGETLDQRSAHILFADSYIEITSVYSDSESHHLAAFLDPPWGIRLLLLRSTDIERSAEVVASTGMVPGPRQDASREIDYGDGGTARFRWFALPVEACRDALICYVEHRTPERVFGYAGVHPNGASNLASIGCVGRRAGGTLQRLANSNDGIPLIRYEADDIDRLFGLDASELTPLCVVGIEVGDVDVTRAWFDTAGVDYTESDGALATVAADTGFIFAASNRARR